MPSRVSQQPSNGDRTDSAAGQAHGAPSMHAPRTRPAAKWASTAAVWRSAIVPSAALPVPLVAGGGVRREGLIQG
jgi:hypothetical protein